MHQISSVYRSVFKADGMKSIRHAAACLFAAVSILVVCASPSCAAQTLNVYGPGGPAPAMKEAAASFGATHNVEVNVTTGPTPKWGDRANRTPTWSSAAPKT
jgi:accessory colonization factor AcfC